MIGESPAIFLADFGIEATAGTASGLVIFDTPGQLVLGDARMAIEYAITYRPSDFPALRKGNAITIGGAAYKVRVPEPLDDGVFWRATVEKV